MTSVSIVYKTRNLVFALLIIGGGLLFPAAAHAVEQGGLGGKPAHPKAENTRSQSIFVHTLKPGKSATDGVLVINNTGKTKNVLVYAVDSQVSSDGAFACAQAADKPLSVGTWATMAKSELTLLAGEKKTVDFTIKVPDNATPGEHNGCIVIQDTERQPASGSNGIVLSLRSAIRLAVTVPGQIQKGLVFTGLDVQPKDNEKLLFSTALKNNGNVSLDTQVDVKLVSLLGVASAQVGGSFPVLNDNESRFNFEASRPFWGGWYRLAASARYNDNPNVMLGEGGSNAMVSRSSWIFIAPQPIAAAIEGALIAVVIGGLYYFAYRRLHHKKAMRRAADHIVGKGEDLHGVAERYAMSWKYLARINKLKAPYTIKPGQKLIVTSVQKKDKKGV